MLIVETIRKIRLLIQRDNNSIRQTAEDLGISRNTIRRVIRSQQTAFSYQRRVQPRPVLGAYMERIHESLAYRTPYEVYVKERLNPKPVQVNTVHQIQPPFLS